MITVSLNGIFLQFNLNTQLYWKLVSTNRNLGQIWGDAVSWISIYICRVICAAGSQVTGQSTSSSSWTETSATMSLLLNPEETIFTEQIMLNYLKKSKKEVDLYIWECVINIQMYWVKRLSLFNILQALQFTW